jgi:hypothetical protein
MAVYLNIQGFYCCLYILQEEDQLHQSKRKTPLENFPLTAGVPSMDSYERLCSVKRAFGNHIGMFPLHRLQTYISIFLSSDVAEELVFASNPSGTKRKAPTPGSESSKFPHLRLYDWLCLAQLLTPKNNIPFTCSRSHSRWRKSQQLLKKMITTMADAGSF